jgi:hypothetical protein
MLSQCLMSHKKVLLPFNRLMAALQFLVVQACLWENLRMHIKTRETGVLEHLKSINRHFDTLLSGP